MDSIKIELVFSTSRYTDAALLEFQLCGEGPELKVKAKFRFFRYFANWDIRIMYRCRCTHSISIFHDVLLFVTF